MTLVAAVGCAPGWLVSRRGSTRCVAVARIGLRRAVWAAGGLKTACGLVVPVAGCQAVRRAAGRVFGPVSGVGLVHGARPGLRQGSGRTAVVAAFVQVTAVSGCSAHSPYHCVKRAMTREFAVIGTAFVLENPVFVHSFVKPHK